MDMENILEDLPDALTTPVAAREIVERLSKIFGIFGDQREVWDLFLRSRERMMYSQYMEDELKRRGTTSADVVVLDRILFAADIVTSIMPEGFDILRLFTAPTLISYSGKYELSANLPGILMLPDDEDIRAILERVRPLP